MKNQIIECKSHTTGICFADRIIMSLPKRRHICLAEDDPDDYYLFSGVMEEISGLHKLTWFVRCEDLLEYLKGGNELPDVIVLDMNMPKIDGQACLLTLKKEADLLHIPVIIFSTANCPATIKAAYEAGALKYYVKPHSIEEFRKIVQEIVSV